MLRQTDADQAHFKSAKEQFFQALYDNLLERFPKTEILTAAQVLDVNMLSQDCLHQTLFGGRELLNEELFAKPDKSTLPNFEKNEIFGLHQFGFVWFCYFS